MTPFKEMYFLLPFVAMNLPVLLVIVFVCFSEVDWPKLAQIKPSRTYRCWAWYLSAMAVFSLFAFQSHFLGKIVSWLRNYIGEIANWISWAIIPLGLALIAIGVWQPLWRAKGAEVPRIIRCLPLILIAAALLGPLSGIFFVFSWPSMFIIEPLTIALIAVIVYSIAKR